MGYFEGEDICAGATCSAAAAAALAAAALAPLSSAWASNAGWYSIAFAGALISTRGIW